MRFMKIHLHANAKKKKKILRSFVLLVVVFN